MIWRERRTLLLILAALLLGNIIFFFTYRVQYQSRLDDMDARLAQAEGQLARSKQARADAEQAIVSYRRVEKDVQTVFDEHWSTQPRRLTLMIAEVKRLAEASNAVPRTLSFDRADSVSTDGKGKNKESVGAREVGIGFSVVATYDQARRMINLLELSQQFVIIDRISLSAGEANELALNLHIKTLFRDEQQGVGGKRL
jgi:hypothetical protein